MRRTSRRRVAISLLLAFGAAACQNAAPSRRYELTGQVLAVQADPPKLTIKDVDIPGFMPGMTMTFDVAPRSLVDGRAPGELVRATLEVTNSLGVLIAIARTGMAPLPESSPGTLSVADLLDVGDLVPDVALIDQDDRRRSLSEWRGTLTVVTFIYTRCPLPNYCPLMDQSFATLQRAVAEDPALRGQVRLVSVSFDPEFDTPAMLRAHAARRKADPAVWTFLTGDRVTIERFAGRFGVSTMRTPPDVNEVTHNLRTGLIGRDGRLAKIYSGNEWTPSVVLMELRRAARRP